MCGRFLNKLHAAEIARIFGMRNPLTNYPARVNIAPTDPALIVVLIPGVSWLRTDEMKQRFGVIGRAKKSDD